MDEYEISQVSQHFLQHLRIDEYKDHPLFRSYDHLKQMLQKRENLGTSKYKIILGFSSNMVSSGLREQIRHMVQHQLVDIIITTAGGIEEDLIKCVGGKTFLGNFQTFGRNLREAGLNRVGNLLIPNSNYANFEDFITPVFQEISNGGSTTTPSEIIALLGKAVCAEESIYSHCYRNSIDVFCPALTDGSIGDMMFFYNFNSERFIVDVLRDVQKLNDAIQDAESVGIILLGAGLPKHHALRACRMSRTHVADVIQVSTSDFVDTSVGSSDSNNLSENSRITIVNADATLVFPLLISAISE
uniref:Deoxyhypusine synthase n=1 Tax=Paramoeba aestuarina TaxID=180227 RepID=A0A7S4L741_9EUKA|mmetsp:Transcript_32560/g.50919  ORF Transcript_32560/g.50919 Transcript_32560/m.50919 type:complete len:301 (-) Transcript_32560:19-921(-)